MAAKNGFGKKTAQPSRRLTDPEKRHMMAVLLRNEAAFGAAYRVLKSTHLYEWDYATAVTWEAARRLFEEHGTLAKKPQLRLELNALHDAEDGTLDDEHLALALQFLAWAYDSELSEEYVHSKPAYKKAVEAVVVFVHEIDAAALAEKLADDLTPADDLPVLLAQAMTEHARTESIRAPKTSKLFQPGWARRTLKPLFPVGIPVLDHFTGGHRGGEIFTFMGPYGSCKTTLACHALSASCEQAASLFHSGKSRDGRVPKVILASYEADREEVQNRIIACLAKVPVPRMLKLGAQGLSYFSNSTTARPGYEQKLFASSLAANLPVPTERERVEQAVNTVNQFLCYYDFSGEDDQSDGTGGVIEIVGRIEAELHDDKGWYPYVMWLDHAAAMVESYLNAHGAKGGDAMAESYVEFSRLPSAIKRSLAVRYRMPVWVLQQLSGKAQDGKPTSRVKYNDAHHCRAWAQAFNFCIQTASLTEDIKRLGVFTCTKHRRMPPTPRLVIRVDGRFNRVLSVNQHYTIDPYSGSILSKAEMDQAPASGSQQAQIAAQAAALYADTSET